ncbi:MAG: VIT domain-containing protein, partial [Myxococcota bacterium]
MRMRSIFALCALSALVGQANARATTASNLGVTAERDMGQPLALSADERQAIGAVYTDPGEIPQLQVQRDGKTLDLPLEHTHVKSEITGFVARVEVTQTYSNPFDHPIEAIYVFPLPENSAVDDMRMEIGKRVVVAEIKKRQDAKATYEQAKRDGHTAALLEQERPNVFTQSVANIVPGEKINVVISYLQTLTYDDGQYEYVFPMVVGPRFMPGTPTGKQGRGWSPDTNRVPDASRISPPILGGGLRSGHDISLELVAQAGIPIRGWDVPTHRVEETPTYDGSLKLKLSDADSIPNRDFVLRYAVDGKLPQATLLTHANGKRGGFFSLVIQPP